MAHGADAVATGSRRSGRRLEQVALLNALMVDAGSAFRFRCSEGDGAGLVRWLAAFVRWCKRLKMVELRCVAGAGRLVEEDDA